MVWKSERCVVGERGVRCMREVEAAWMAGGMCVGVWVV